MFAAAAILLAQAAPAAPVAPVEGIHFSGTELIYIATMVLGAMGAAVAAVFKMLMSAKDKAYEDMRGQLTRAYEDMKQEKDVYKQLASDADKVMRVAVNAKLAAEGKPIPEQLARVIPEHQSPVTEEQQAIADKATLRASITAAALALGEPARVAGDKDQEQAADEDAEAVAIAKEKQQAGKRAEKAAADIAAAGLALDKDHIAVAAIKDALDAKANPPPATPTE